MLNCQGLGCSRMPFDLPPGLPNDTSDDSDGSPFSGPSWGVQRRSLSGVGASIGDPFEGAGIETCSKKRFNHVVPSSQISRSALQRVRLDGVQAPSRASLRPFLQLFEQHARRALVSWPTRGASAALLLWLRQQTLKIMQPETRRFLPFYEVLWFIMVLSLTFESLLPFCFASCCSSFYSGLQIPYCQACDPCTAT